MKPTTICHSILEMPERHPDHVAVKTKIKEGWKDWTWAEYYNQIDSLANGLLELGIKADDRIAIFSNTRFEWCICDFAIMGIHGVTVPIYQTATPEDVEIILNNSEARFIFIENKSLYKTLNLVRGRCPAVEKIILIDGASDANWMTWNEVMALGVKRQKREPDAFPRLCESVKPEDIATLLYTSGTTGNPKGVVLTHVQAMSEISEAFTSVGLTHEDIGLTFLPYAHILGRVEHWGHTYIGYTLAFAESIDKIRYNLLEIQPTVMIAVPRIFEKIYGAIWAQVEPHPAKSRIFNWAIKVGKKVGSYKLKRQPLPALLLAEYKLAQALALNKIKEAFGGRLRFAISGGAPLASDLALFFHAADILILQGYGLTETTAAICMNTPYDYSFDSVGKPVGEVQLKIAADGEILVKSKKVMREYYKDPEATKAAFEDGWFKTGDIGEISSSGHLRITDRKKDLIKTAGGKYVAPQRLENLIKMNSIVSQVLIHGDQKKYIVALITLDKPFLLGFAKQNGIQYQDFTTLTQHPTVLEAVRKGVAEANAHLASYETIKRFTVLPTDFTVEAGELTPSLKVKRKVLDQKYKKEIETLYN